MSIYECGKSAYFLMSQIFDLHTKKSIFLIVSLKSKTKKRILHLKFKKSTFRLATSLNIFI